MALSLARTRQDPLAASVARIVQSLGGPPGDSGQEVRAWVRANLMRTVHALIDLEYQMLRDRLDKLDLLLVGRDFRLQVDWRDADHRLQSAGATRSEPSPRERAEGLLRCWDWLEEAPPGLAVPSSTRPSSAPS